MIPKVIHTCWFTKDNSKDLPEKMRLNNASNERSGDKVYFNFSKYYLLRFISLKDSIFGLIRNACEYSLNSNMWVSLSSNTNTPIVFTAGVYQEVGQYKMLRSDNYNNNY